MCASLNLLIPFYLPFFFLPIIYFDFLDHYTNLGTFSDIIGGAAGLALISEDDILFCGSPEQCVNSSMNIGMVKIANNTQCCRTALCNNKALPGKTKQFIFIPIEN